MQKALAGLLFSLFFVLNAMAQSSRHAEPDPSLRSDNAQEIQILELVNRQRRRENLSTLLWNEDLARVARLYSERMSREGFFDHYDPAGRTVIDRASKIHGWSRIGENLFVCDEVRDLGSFAIRGWMASPTHRNNILDPAWTSSGVGIAHAADGQIYITQIFTQR
ncbi:MAG: CAP domain-containing protein [Pyrinomonadaceae bacterium]